MEEQKMQQIQNKEEIKSEIARIRQRYARLKAVCGPFAISKATMEEYAREIGALEAQLA
jgi:hypothetical protein